MSDGTGNEDNSQSAAGVLALLEEQWPFQLTEPEIRRLLRTSGFFQDCPSAIAEQELLGQAFARLINTGFAYRSEGFFIPSSAALEAHGLS